MLLRGCKRPDTKEERRNTDAEARDGQQRRDAANMEAGAGNGSEDEHVRK